MPPFYGILFQNPVNGIAVTIWFPGTERKRESYVIQTRFDDKTKTNAKSGKIRFIYASMLAAAVMICAMGFNSVGQVRAADAKLDSVNTVNENSRISSTASVLPESLAKKDPMAFLEMCREKYRQEIKDYRCTFVKHEFVNGKLRPQQTADVRFREEPFSVDMTFVQNVGQCKRALYIKGKWVDSDGAEQTLAKPGNSLLAVFVPKIKQPIHGDRAKKASRRTIDQFGFGKSLDLILHYSQKAQNEGLLQLEYVGEGKVDDRPTYVFERKLPYNGDETIYPDGLLVVHVDQEYLLPTACHSYADQKKKELLGTYVYKDVRLNIGYEDKDFDPEVIGF